MIYDAGTSLATDDFDDDSNRIVIRRLGPRW
jgi:hypothetical protein